MATATMQTNEIHADYVVLDELADADLADAGTKKRKARGPGEENPSADGDAGEMADLMQEMTATAVRKGFEMGREEFKRTTDAEVLALRKEREAQRAELLALKAMHSKPTCFHVKFGEHKPVKLSTRVSPLLADIMMQAEIGRSGGKWPLVMGPTGSGKTVLARQLAEAWKLPFRYINGSEGMGETAFFGKETVKGFVPGPLWLSATQGGVFLFDEFDALNDNTAAGVNTILTSPVGSMITNPFSGETLPVHKDFVAIAATNTNGKGGDGKYTGRNRLDAASLNRFAIFELGYDLDLEREICQDSHLLEKLWSIRVALTEKKSGDVISTRDIADAFAQKQKGYPEEKIFACLARRMDKANYDLVMEKAKAAAKKGGK